MKYRQFSLIFTGLVILFLLTGCSPWIVTDQGSTDQWITINSGNSIGQTFVAEFSGLQAVHLLLKPQVPGTGILTMHLRSDPSSLTDLATVKISLPEINSQRSYRFDFPQITQSNNQYYYAFLNIDGEGSVDVGSGPADVYQNGAAYQNHEPVEAQLTFSLEYDREALFVEIVRQLAQWLMICLVSILLFTIPGWALMSLVWRSWKELSGFEKLPLSIGVSLAFYILFVLVTYLIGLQLGRWYSWIPVIIGLIVIVWRNRHNFSINKSIGDSPRDGAKEKDNKHSFWPDLGLIIILGLIFLARFWAMRGLDQPMWNDSLHHTEITQLILDHQGLFSSWLPYAAYKTFSMHYGFPLGAALLAWITRVSSGQAVLYFGQVLCIFAPLALYPLTVRLTHGNRIAGVVAVLAAGLLSSMPAYYINWGRYAQLAGQVILPVAMWMVWEVVDSTSGEQASSGWLELPWAKIIITGGIIAGMVLCEFRMIFVIATFVIALAIGQLIKYIRVNSRLWLREVWSLGLVGFTSIVLFLPWGLRLRHSNLINLSDFNSQINSIINLVRLDYITWQNIRFYVPIGLIFLGVSGLIWAIIKRDWAVASLGLWVAGMAVLYSLTLLHIPWVQYVQSFAVLISLYIPMGLFVGYLVSNLTEWLSKWKPGNAVVFSAVIVFGLAGALSQRNISHPDSYAFVTRPDSLAMSWINAQTPENSRFLIEGIHENWVTNVIGTDAGWWIPLLANRENTIPPQYALANETPVDQGYSLGVVNLQATLEEKGVTSQDGIKLLCDYGITHVYIGQKQGAVGNPSKPLFTPAELATNGVFRLVYHIDRVYIYSVENACSQ